MRSEELAARVVQALEEVKAVEIRSLDVRGLTSITDFMVIASGKTHRQVKAMAGKVLEAAQEAGIKPLGVEGEGPAEWILVDLGDVVVHAMQPATRDFYQLEKLWSDFDAHRRGLMEPHPPPDQAGGDTPI